MDKTSSQELPYQALKDYRREICLRDFTQSLRCIPARASFLCRMRSTVFGEVIFRVVPRSHSEKENERSWRWWHFRNIKDLYRTMWSPFRGHNNVHSKITLWGKLSFVLSEQSVKGFLTRLPWPGSVKIKTRKSDGHAICLPSRLHCMS